MNHQVSENLVKQLDLLRKIVIALDAYDDPINIDSNVMLLHTTLCFVSKAFQSALDLRFVSEALRSDLGKLNNCIVEGTPSIIFLDSESLDS